MQAFNEDYLYISKSGIIETVLSFQFFLGPCCLVSFAARPLFFGACALGTGASSPLPLVTGLGWAAEDLGSSFSWLPCLAGVSLHSM